MQGCSSVLYFEARKHKDLYLWVAKAPAGPSVKFHVTNGGRRVGLAGGGTLALGRGLLGWGPLQLLAAGAAGGRSGCC